MINNKKILIPFLNFDYPESVVYQIQIIARRKENPEQRKNARTIKQYYLHNENDLEKIWDSIVNLADYGRARVYLNLDAKSSRSIAHRINDLSNTYIEQGQFNSLDNIFQKAYGHSDTNTVGQKRWILDLDDVDLHYVQRVMTWINNFYENAKLTDRSCFFVETPNGFHVIANPFDVKRFEVEFPEVEIKKGSPTILYVPDM